MRKDKLAFRQIESGLNNSQPSAHSTFALDSCQISTNDFAMTNLANVIVQTASQFIMESHHIVPQCISKDKTNIEIGVTPIAPSLYTNVVSYGDYVSVQSYRIVDCRRENQM